MAVFDGELSRSRRSKLSLSLLMFDLDRFKEINDQFGHLCGDEVLSVVGKRMGVVLRASDLKCRYGGEEFLVLLPDTGLAGAERVAELLRSELEGRPARWNDQEVRVTASFGVTLVTPGDLDVTALYRVKETGRNYVWSDGGRVESDGAGR
jgi:diguanylate cyclase (GGDEF)-like protein